ncbi:MAG TPA: hypothetical protein VJ302_05655 [Blastocatellia bacterium]|nr:hypothetical protein [Blastocatellia bacterium]
MKILVAYDGSDCADAAPADLQRAGLPQDLAVTVLSVAESWLPPPSGSALGGLFLGSVSQQVATDTGCSVRVARKRSNASNLPPRLLVAVDGSAGSYNRRQKGGVFNVEPDPYA